MGKRKWQRQYRRNLSRPQDDWTIWAPWWAMVGAFLLAYIVAEAELSRYPHPLHWLAAIGGGAAGYLGGVLFRLWKTTP